MIKELKQKIEELEESIFYLDMVDHWTKEDRELSDKYYSELVRLKGLLLEELSKVGK